MFSQSFFLLWISIIGYSQQDSIGHFFFVLIIFFNYLSYFKTSENSKFEFSWVKQCGQQTVLKGCTYKFIIIIKKSNSNIKKRLKKKLKKKTKNKHKKVVKIVKL